ncbi:MAG TPA: 16S rRNA (uracil(1498)-N(3))-methyltransferase [Mycobacteriales bacterium]|nr:16S rRNA (uracil(1498)-N(3))-methyltransferase [Mycobacteriales bacterium]
MVVLDGAEGRHAATVRRLRVGERVDLVDGEGLRAHATVTAVGKDTLELRVERRTAEPAPAPRLVVVQALIKGDRTELAAELLTEAGVDEIVPWAAERCVVRWDAAKAVKGEQRLRASVHEAAKQARRARWPVVAPLAGTAQVEERLRAARSSGGASYVLHESGDRSLAASNLPASGDVVLVVGPEGGISDAELSVLTGAGGSAVRLGPEVLRASTAGVVAVAALASRLGRWTTPGTGEPA